MGKIQRIFFLRFAKYMVVICEESVKFMLVLWNLSLKDEGFIVQVIGSLLFKVIFLSSYHTI